MNNFLLKIQLLFVFTAAVLFTAAPAWTQSIDEPTVNMDMVNTFIEEGIERSQIMDMASYLTDVIGPRLTNSPQMYRANEWAAEMMESFGLQNVYQHEWGPFGRGWELTRFAMHAQSDQTYFPVIAYPKAWSPGYDEAVSGEVVFLEITEEKDFDYWRGRLEGKFVMIAEPAEPQLHWDAIARRHTDESLLRLANATQRIATGQQGGQSPNAAWIARQQAAYERAQFLMEERPLAILDESYRGWSGQVAISGATLPAPPGTPWGERPRPHQIDAPTPVPQVSLAREHYGRIFRMLQHGKTVELEMDLRVRFQEENLMGWNTIGSIPGTDPDLKDEFVVIGAHLDSWHTGTGATDNAAGSVVMLEAMRILQEAGVAPRRTIKIALWSGEEQGLIGSREFVETYLARPEGNPASPSSITRLDGYDKFSAYFNVDNGAGQIRGIYLQQNDAVRNLFRTWLLPFADWGTETVSWANTGSTDHVVFDRVGLPGFQFIQDPLEYFTLSHHSNMDTYERLVPQDLMRNAVIVATFAYHTAMLDERLPRKPGPELSAN
ncbi:Peptidase family M28 [Cyclonatronum proteinivorum]|uniref:Carboxypeptidase Q n=1 Tax=Cyclonatronum proteinivorum TaxID=1457365 RepID=A0A345ULJ0_9BACT|nr:M20/M25/M40 family metallo-hydrolase [Cyclonatronum proteinivorum]AXJ01342.1 Peptidase family M28 [Cyclonatronum proteinivorum]